MGVHHTDINCECGGKVMTISEQVAEDVVDTWAECRNCRKKTDAYEDSGSSRHHHDWAASEFIKKRFV